MRFKNEDAENRWNEFVTKNSVDPYSNGVVTYAKAWAELMEKVLAPGGMVVAEIAKQASHDADTEGITGFMFGAAVHTLSDVWVYGEELRRWHNLDSQIGDEGEKANESGGVLNPALLVTKAT